MTAPVRIGTRASRLALTQSTWVAETLTRLTGRETELVTVRTEGDRNLAPLTQIGGTGVFVGAVRDALLDGRVDVAVHSLKDLPTTPHPGLAIGAVPAREDARDVVVARDGLTLGELPRGATVGTGSPRRAAQINALGLGLDVVEVRGNVDTRIGKVRDGLLDAVVLARAGLARIGRLDDVTEVLDPLQMLPAPGQGALACEARDDDDVVLALLAALDDPATRTAVTAERALLAALEAGCTAPVGALAEVALGEDGDELWVRGLVAAPEGSPLIRKSLTGSPADPVQVGERLAAEMLADGASALVEAS